MTLAFHSRGARMALLYALIGPLMVLLVIGITRVAGCVPGPGITMQCAHMSDGLHILMLVVSAGTAVYVTPGLILLSVMLEALARRRARRAPPRTVDGHWT